MNVSLSIIFAKYLGIGVTGGGWLATVCCQMLGVAFLPVFTKRFIQINEKKNKK